MAKKKALAGFAAGTRVRVRAGVMSPEFPEISISGWTGSVTEAVGKPPMVASIIEWDQPTLDAMPAEYVQECEAQQLYYRMAHLNESDLEVI
jgi:hypothetical protein